MKNGMLEWRSLASLKASVILTFVVLWNAGCLTGVYLNGGWEQVMSRPGKLAMAATCVAACGFALAVALSRGVQDALLAESRRKNFRRSDFAFVGLLAGGIAVLALVSA